MNTPQITGRLRPAAGEWGERMDHALPPTAGADPQLFPSSASMSQQPRTWGVVVWQCARTASS